MSDLRAMTQSMPDETRDGNQTNSEQAFEVQKQKEVRESNAQFLPALLSISRFAWAGALSFGAMAALLINALTSENLNDGVIKVLVNSTKISLILFGTFALIIVCAISIVASGSSVTKNTKRWDVDWLSSWLAFIVAIIAFLAAIYLFKQGFIATGQLWESLNELSK
ncbi:hypothetical protein ACXYMP_06430 [Aliiroseovarius sp. CAU 1755]